MIIWDDEIIQAIGRRRSVIVIGAGISKNSQNDQGRRPANWEEFLVSAAATFGNPEPIKSLIERKDFLTACELIKKKVTRDGFIKLVQNEYQKPGYKSAKIHDHIYALDSSIVISPNFDNIYDTHALKISNGTIIIKDHTSSDIIKYLSGGENRLLIKTHGSANTPGSIIFTRNEYAEARTKYTLFYEILKSLILTHTFILVGCGIDDPDIRMLFEDVKFAHDQMPHHYMTIPSKEVHEDILNIISESMKIKFLQYSDANGHAELTESLEDLVTKVDDYRAQKSIDQKW